MVIVPFCQKVVYGGLGTCGLWVLLGGRWWCVNGGCGSPLSISSSRAFTFPWRLIMVIAGGGCNLPLSISSSRAFTFPWRLIMVIKGGGCNSPLSISSSSAFTFPWHLIMVIEGEGWRVWLTSVYLLQGLHLPLMFDHGDQGRGVEGVTYLCLSPPPAPSPSPDIWSWWSRVEGGGCNLPLSISSSRAFTFPWHLIMVIEGGGCNLPLSISSSRAFTFPWRLIMVIEGEGWRVWLTSVYLLLQGLHLPLTFDHGDRGWTVVGGGCNLPLSISSSRAFTFPWCLIMVIEGGGCNLPLSISSSRAFTFPWRLIMVIEGGRCNLPLSISSSRAFTFPWRLIMVIKGEGWRVWLTSVYLLLQHLHLPLTLDHGDRGWRV